MIQQEIDRVRKQGHPYTGAKVFINRDDKAKVREGHKRQSLEVIECYKLYRKVHLQSEGAITIDGTKVWITTCQVPNQGHHRRRCADILGLRSDGSLLVFEAKVANGSDTPLAALLEGLDYLSHLRIPRNMEKLQDGFAKWRATHGQPGVYSKTPDGFEKVEIDPEARHSVLVLAPEAYYERHRKDSKKVNQNWKYLSDRIWPKSPLSVGLDFAITDFYSPECKLLSLNVLGAQ